MGGEFSYFFNSRSLKISSVDVEDSSESDELIYRESFSNSLSESVISSLRFIINCLPDCIFNIKSFHSCSFGFITILSFDVISKYSRFFIFLGNLRKSLDEKSAHFKLSFKSGMFSRQLLYKSIFSNNNGIGHIIFLILQLYAINTFKFRGNSTIIVI